MQSGSGKPTPRSTGRDGQQEDMTRLNTTGSDNLHIIDSYYNLERGQTNYTAETIVPAASSDLATMNNRLNQLMGKGEHVEQANPSYERLMQSLSSPPRNEHYIPPRIVPGHDKKAATQPENANIGGSNPPPRQFHNQTATAPKLTEEPVDSPESTEFQFPQGWVNQNKGKSVPIPVKPTSPPPKKSLPINPPERSKLTPSPDPSFIRAQAGGSNTKLPTAPVGSTSNSNTAARDDTIVPKPAPIPDFPKRNRNNAPAPPATARTQGELDITGMSSNSNNTGNSNFILGPLRKVSDKIRGRGSKEKRAGMHPHRINIAPPPVSESQDSSSPESPTAALDLDRSQQMQFDMDRQHKVPLHLQLPPKAQSTDTNLTRFAIDSEHYSTADGHARESRDKKRRKKVKKQSFRRRCFGNVSMFTVIVLFVLIANVVIVDSLLLFLAIKLLPDVGQLQTDVQKLTDFTRTTTTSAVPSLSVPKVSESGSNDAIGKFNSDPN